MSASYQLNWTFEGERKVVVCSYLPDRHAEPQELFKDYANADYGNYFCEFQVMKRVLSYHIGRDPEANMVERFIARPTVSRVVVTEKELNDFFGETKEQGSLRV